MRTAFFAGCLVLALAFAPSSTACDLHSVYTALEAKDLGVGWYSSLFQQYSDFGTLQEDGEEIDDEADQALRSAISQFVVGYQFNRRFGVQTNVPLIDRSFRRPEGEAIERGSESGVGDLSLLAHYRVLQRANQNQLVMLHLLGGVKAPTGNSDRLGEELEEGHREEGGEHALSSKHDGEEHHEAVSGVHGHDLALGSGSWDGVVGATGYFRQGRFFANASVHYVARQEGDFDYRFANDTSWTFAPGFYLWLSSEGSFTLAAQVSGEKKGQDSLAGEVLDDTAIDSIYAGPALSLSRGNHLFTELDVDLPIQQENSAVQIVQDYRVRFAFTWRFGS